MSALLAAVVIAQSPADAGLGAKIVASYRAIRAESPGRFAYKGQRIGSEVERLEALPRIPDAAVPRYVASCALNSECGDLRFLPKNAQPLLARYGPALRAKWSPEARRLWEEAFYTNRTPASAIDALRREGQDVGALEAHFIGWNGAEAATDYPKITRLLDYSETHPKDIVGAIRAALLLNGKTAVALVEKRPVRRDLLERTLALYPRTLRNVNALMDDHLPSLLYFRVLNETARRARGGP